MEAKALRLFSNEVTGEIVWYHELRGTGVYPTTIEEDLAEIPSKRPHPIADGNGNIISNPSLGGSIDDYECYETYDLSIIERYFSFQGSTVTISQVLGG